MASRFPDSSSRPLPDLALDSFQGPSAEAYIANLSGQTLILTALLPEDASSTGSLLFSILDSTELNAPPPGQPFNETNKDRLLRPGEVGRLFLSKPPQGKHTALLRVRKEGQPGSCFLRYTVDPAATLHHLGSQTLGRLEHPSPHLVYIW